MDFQLLDLKLKQKPKKFEKKQKQSFQNQQKNQFREGDWVCMKCNNLNFSFRNKCNRCNNQTKQENDELQKLKSDFQSNNQSIWQSNNNSPSNVFIQNYDQGEMNHIFAQLTPQKVFGKNISNESASTAFSENFIEEERNYFFESEDNKEKKIAKKILTKFKSSSSSKNNNQQTKYYLDYEEKKFLEENKLDEQQIKIFNTQTISELIVPVRYANIHLPDSDEEFSGFQDLMQSINEFHFIDLDAQ